MRELLLRTSPLRRGKWLFAIVSSIGLAFSAIYEFVEWPAATAADLRSEPEPAAGLGA